LIAFSADVAEAEAAIKAFLKASDVPASMGDADHGRCRQIVSDLFARFTRAPPTCRRTWLEGAKARPRVRGRADR